MQDVSTGKGQLTRFWRYTAFFKTNNTQVMNTSELGYPRLTLKEGPKVNLTTKEDSEPMISYRVFFHIPNLLDQ